MISFCFFAFAMEIRACAKNVGSFNLDVGDYITSMTKRQVFVSKVHSLIEEYD